MFELSAEIIYNRRIKKGYFEIALSAPAIAKTASAGQFVNIRVSGGLEPLLRRPLSIHRVGQKSKVKNQKSKECIVMLYESVGKGTEILSQRRPGEFLDIIGPLGNGFVYEGRGATPPAAGQADERRIVLVAGGMGTAPLVFLAERLSKRWTKDDGRRTIVLIGARTKEAVLCEQEFKKLGCEVRIATDDGSRGFKGYVSELLKQGLSTIDYRPSTIYACGPKLLLKEISRISLEQNIPAQLSLESHMACGIGACMGCVIKTRDEGRGTRDEFKYKRVCKEGPVFEAREIIW